MISQKINFMALLGYLLTVLAFSPPTHTHDHGPSFVKNASQPASQFVGDADLYPIETETNEEDDFVGEGRAKVTNAPSFGISNRETSRLVSSPYLEELKRPPIA